MAAAAGPLDRWLSARCGRDIALIQDNIMQCMTCLTITPQHDCALQLCAVPDLQRRL